MLIIELFKYTPHDGDVTYSSCSAAYRQNH